MSNILVELKNKIKLIAGDASFRKFYRFLNQKGQLLVYCEKDKYNNLNRYDEINTFLRANKILAPKTLKRAIKQNYLIIQDFGDDIVKNKIISSKKSKIIIYKKIIHELIKIQNIKLKNIKLNHYSYALLKKEFSIFFDWYLPEFFKKNKISKIRKAIFTELKKLLDHLSIKKKVFVQRDFHVENLIFFNRKIAIIDSQDAVLGSPTYDIMSLIDDVRIQTNINLKNQILNYYLQKSKIKNSDNFISDFHILSIQRSLKILGIFVRLFRRDHKDKYLKYLPYTWKLIELRLNHPKLFRLKKIINQYFTKKIKNQKKFK